MSSSSSGWSSSSEDEFSDDEENSEEFPDPDARTSGKRSQEEISKGNPGKAPLPRLSHLYSLDKALSCRQLVKQVNRNKRILHLNGFFYYIHTHMCIHLYNILMRVVA